MAAKARQVERFTATSAVRGMSTILGPFETVVIYVDGGDIRWTDRPQDETISSSVGTLLKDGDSMEYRGDYLNWRCVLAAGTPAVAIHKYQRNVGW